MSFVFPVFPRGSVPMADLDVYAKLPDTLAGTGRHSSWAMTQRGSEALPAFLEGPVLTPEGDILMVDVAWGRILRLDAHSEFSVVYEYDGAPNGLAMRPDGALVIADHHLGLLVLEEPLESPRLVTVAEGLGHERFRGLNDLVVDDEGAVLVTDQGGTGLQDPTGRVLRFHPRSGWQTLLDNVPSPNGIALSDDRRWVYVAVTRDNSIWRIPFDPTGAVTKVGRFVQLSGGEGPDGLAVGPGGTLLVAHLGVGVVWVVDHRGLVVAGLRSPAGLATTNLAVDRSHNRVYVVESETSSVLTAELDNLELEWGR